MSLTWLYAVVYSALVRLGGVGVRNCLAERITKGLTVPQYAPRAIGLWLIGSWRHLPG